MASLYEPATGQSAAQLPYRRAALAFMSWQLRRGLLNPLDGSGHATAGSPWWRAVNERLLRDTAEARATLLGHDGEPSSPSAASSIAFARRPSARSWYRAHNASVIAAYLEHEQLAAAENRVERSSSTSSWFACSSRMRSSPLRGSRSGGAPRSRRCSATRGSA